MQAVDSSEVMVTFYQTAHCHIFIFTAIRTTNLTNLSCNDALLKNILIHQVAWMTEHAQKWTQNIHAVHSRNA